MVDWKKDIKLSDLLARDREAAEAADEATPLAEQPDSERTEVESEEAKATEATPFWKREISFRRQKEESETDPDFDVPADEPGKRPFFKRDLSFSRTKCDAAHEADVDSSADEAEETTPFWKRELGFGRAKDDVVPAQGDADEDTDFAAAPESEETTPFWKRDLSFRRRKDDAPEASSDSQEPSWEDADPVAVAPESPVELEQPVHIEPEPVIASVTEAEPVEEAPFWKRELSFGRAKSEAATDSDRDEPASATDEAPFWKREIKFGRRREDEIGEPVPIEPAAPREEAAPIAAAFASDSEDKKPFWKRDLKFGRTKEESGSDAGFDAGHELKEKKAFFKREFSFRRAKDPDFDAPEKRSFFKRQHGLRRRKAHFKAGTDIVDPAAQTEKRPFFKRELSFRRGKVSGREPGTPRSAKAGRTKQLVGLKVGASQIAAAQVVNNGSPVLVQLARQSIEQGIVVGGELRDPDALAEVLRDFFAKHKLPSRNVRLGIGNNRIGVRSFEISGVHDPKQLENAIRFRAQEALPIPLDEAVLDYQVIEEASSPTGIRTYRVLLVVAYRELIDRYVAACRGAGLRLVGIDLEAFALLRALSPPPSEGFPEDTALVAISIGHDRSTFAVSNGTVCEFTRVLDWGGSSLNTAIARALDMTPSQAEPVKRTLSLSADEDGAGTQQNEHTIRAEEAVRLELQTFARELVSSLHFYQNQPGSLAIGTITLTGGTAHLPGLADELQRLIGVKVRVGDPLRRVKTGKRVEAPEQVGSMAVAIGLGIED